MSPLPSPHLGLWLLVSGLTSGGLLACGDVADTSATDGQAGAAAQDVGAGGSAGADGTVDAGNPPEAVDPTDAGAAGDGHEPCVAPEGVSAAPGTFVELLELVNALPRPLTMPCFLESLERPLEVTATFSDFSAQPAFERSDPRIFLKIGELYISLVTAGDLPEVMEFSEMTSATRSYKGELEFPLTGPVEPAMLTERIIYQGDLTVCGFCHRGELKAEHPTLGFTFESQALRPMEEYDIPLSELADERARCDAALQPERCAVLGALFDHGPVEPHLFDVQIPKFF